MARGSPGQPADKQYSEKTLNILSQMAISAICQIDFTRNVASRCTFQGREDLRPVGAVLLFCVSRSVTTNLVPDKPCPASTVRGWYCRRGFCSEASAVCKGEARDTSEESWCGSCSELFYCLTQVLAKWEKGSGVAALLLEATGFERLSPARKPFSYVTMQRASCSSRLQGVTAQQNPSKIMQMRTGKP